jgi:hypothetical protein
VALEQEERQELLRLAKSSTLREDMHRLASSRYNPLLIDGRVDLDRWLVFLNNYNEFINHTPKPFRPMSDRVMKL